tara:strand:- start:3672 stop:4514 length:843 start_codon:yes stop_codon:yes gene_type:complete
MGKIVWISSYPKSGNTWMRYLLANYFYNPSNAPSAKIINNIKKFNIDDSLKTTKEELQKIKKNPYNISKYWIPSQKKLLEENDNILFLKNHNSLLKIKENNFSNKNCSLASIYIVRDPRDVVVSYAHYSNLSYDETIDKLLTDKLLCVIDKDNPWNVEVIGSWKFHYLSWKNGIPGTPIIVIRYEDLIRNTYIEFLKVITFLSKILKFKVNYNQLVFSVNASSFKNLKKFEINNDFKENRGQNLFFRKGKTNDWIDNLNKNQISRIEKELSNEIEKLGYK